MPLGPGDVFAGYTIVRLLGSGGMGEVHLAQHPRLPRRDALKILPADVSADPEYRARFNREADLASNLWHPHIVSVHDRGEFEGQLWISMDFVDGQDAARLLADRYPAGMPVEQVVHIVTAVASALDYAHKQGLLHRDVKPANIMLSHLDDEDQQRVLLADFGIARNVDDISGLTTTNMTVGTVAYSAPEQLMGEDVDGRADEYALAATTFHLLTGSQLFPHSNPAVVISRHLNSTPPALSDARPELAALDPVLTAALAKDRDDRFAHCSDFSRALAEQSSAGGSPSSVVETKPAPVSPKSTKDASSHALAADELPHRLGSRRRWLVPVAALAVILLASVIALAWRPWKSGESTGKTTTSTPQPNYPPVTSSAAPPPPAPPPPPPVFPANAIDSVLLTAAEMSKLLGITVTNDTAAWAPGVLKMDASSYGTLDHSAQVKPRSCVGVAFTAEHDVYGGTDFQEIKTQSFSQMYGSSVEQKGPESVEQTAVVFPSADLAQRFLTSSQTQWKACANSEVDVTLGFENGRGFRLGSVQRNGDLITVSMADNGGMLGPHACQQALGARQNVVVEARTCQVPTSVTTPPGEPGDPDWAVPDAERLANTMLNKVKV
jgi:serine/threonine protein kinase